MFHKIKRKLRSQGSSAHLNRERIIRFTTQKTTEAYWSSMEQHQLWNQAPVLRSWEHRKAPRQRMIWTWRDPNDSVWIHKVQLASSYHLEMRKTKIAPQGAPRRRCATKLEDQLTKQGKQIAAKNYLHGTFPKAIKRKTQFKPIFKCSIWTFNSQICQ